MRPAMIIQQHAKNDPKTGKYSAIRVVFALIFFVSIDMDMTARSDDPNTTRPGEKGISRSPGNSGESRGRLDYEHALPFPMPSLDCEPAKQKRAGKENFPGETCAGHPKETREQH
jgi:hypothetical protein